MAIKKKELFNSPFKKGEEGVTSKKGRTLTAGEIKNTQDMVQAIGRGESNGIIIVLEEFIEDGKRGIQGKAFVHNIGPIERIQALVPAMGMPKEMAMQIMKMIPD